MVLTIAVVLGFQDSTSLSSAYGKACATAEATSPPLKGERLTVDYCLLECAPKIVYVKLKIFQSIRNQRPTQSVWGNFAYLQYLNFSLIKGWQTRSSLNSRSGMTNCRCSCNNGHADHNRISHAGHDYGMATAYSFGRLLPALLWHHRARFLLLNPPQSAPRRLVSLPCPNIQAQRSTSSFLGWFSF